ncbi:unnamed protein product, partial [Microthlaspi erraticum]
LCCELDIFKLLASDPLRNFKQELGMWKRIPDGTWKPGLETLSTHNVGNIKQGNLWRRSTHKLGKIKPGSVWKLSYSRRRRMKLNISEIFNYIFLMVTEI